MSESEKKGSSERRRPLSVWELPKLVASVHTHRRPSKTKNARDRRHFPAILAFVYRNRFAIASQIQQRFPEYLPSDRTARRHLAEMQALGYLDVAPTNNTSPLWPKVYFATRRGLRRLQRAYERKGKAWKPYVADRRRSEGHSGQHVLHELLITEFLLMMWETARDDDEFELLTVQRRSLAKHPAFSVQEKGRQHRLQPDGMFVFRQQGKGMMCCFNEIDTGSMTKRQMAAKFDRYQGWIRSEHARKYLVDLYGRLGACSPQVRCRLLVIVTGMTEADERHRAAQLDSIGNERGRSMRGAVWICRSSDFRRSEDPGFRTPVWCCCGKFRQLGTWAS